MKEELKKDIANITWWIPCRKLRDSIRNILINYYEKLNSIENKINSMFYLLNLDTDIRRNEFRNIYKKSLWGNNTTGLNKSKSGSGSSLEITSNLRVKLVDIIKRYNIKNFLDAPCGDMNWMKEILNNIEKYTGVDIVDEVIDENKTKFFGFDNVRFERLDLLKDKLEKVDLIFCRDCIQHLSNYETKLFINNIIRSGSEYLLISSHNNESNGNRDKEKYSSAKALNLEKDPFNFPPPIEYLEEETFDKWIGYNKRMALWKISSIPKQDINILDI